MILADPQVRIVFWSLLAALRLGLTGPAGAAEPWQDAMAPVCARPADDDGPLCAAATRGDGSGLERVASRLERLGRFADATTVETQVVVVTRVGPPAVRVRSLARQALLLRRAGRYGEARTAAKAALAEDLPAGAATDDARALALEADGMMGLALGSYGPAETQLRAALALRQAENPVDPIALAALTNALADAVGNGGKLTDALQLAQNAADLAERVDGKAGPIHAHTVITLALIDRALGRFAEAERLLTASVGTIESARGPLHPDLADALNAAGILYRAMGRPRDAEAATARALEIRVAALGPGHPDVATSANNLAVLYQRSNRLAPAEKLFRQVIAIRESALGPDSPEVGSACNNLADLLRTENRLTEAEAYYVRSVQIRARALGPDHPEVATSLANLALLHRQQDRLSLAENELRRALAIREKALPSDHPDIAATLTNLGDVLVAEDRSDDGIGVYARALTIQEKALGPAHPDLAATLNNLAKLYRDNRQPKQAESFYLRALGILQQAYPAGHPEIANTLGNLAELYREQGRIDEAAADQEAALKIREVAFGPTHPAVATSLLNLALVRRDQKRLADAEPLLRRAIEIRTAAFGDLHPDVANAYNTLADLQTLEDRPADGLESMRRATAIFRGRASRGEEADTRAADGERRDARYAFVHHVELLAATGDGPSQTAEAFEVAQLAQGVSVGSVVAKMAARFAAGTGALSDIVRQQQDAQEQWRRVDATLIKAAATPAAGRDLAAEDQLQAERTALSGQVRNLDVLLHERFPAYAEATSQEPEGLAALQKLLKRDEVMVSYLVAPLATYAWVIRQDGAEMIRLPVGWGQLDQVVRLLRRGLDPSSIAADARDRLPVYDAKLAFELQKKIFAPLVPALHGATHLLVVVDGPLQALPLNVLVGTKPPADLEQPIDYRRVDWLARHYAFAVLPSVNSLRALRAFAKPTAAKEPFLGFGAPRLGGPRLRNRTPVAMQGESIDVNLVNQLNPLPETADELREIARTLKAPVGDVILSDQATRPHLHDLDLADFRVVAFATHGLMAGELKGLTEPALVLTPNQGANPDDGLLRASEIAQLHFDADWVVLSACNTAAAGGETTTESLSGLARAFFYAGSRSILVSHWPVNSGASVFLTTAAVQSVVDDPTLGKAEAVERSMVKLMETGDPLYAHPMMWAPFVVVGEGGAGS
ncbi:MAG TPA: CHAT domain-containing tetratricopeptide repeat protein [Aliidongia sp.]|uniref:CHAT domain-containing tetratricopeptide repeat protein n=1 Tax=Aliidongia sp. TaxID=1914230 RepID=UPI002DDCF446|nr:CHAT domain-containing tetratricopeptide repeat protein [Aliidongia sp.]HEV2676329.1 CHAT domain-containing tetratricopeptide repeat protein [Aliidongia sp.]